MESEKDKRPRRKTGFVDVEGGGEMEMELEMEELASRRRTGTCRLADESSKMGGKAQQAFCGYRYMTPVELDDDDRVTSWTIVRTFEDDTDIHGVDHVGHAIGRSTSFTARLNSNRIHRTK